MLKLSVVLCQAPARKTPAATGISMSASCITRGKRKIYEKFVPVNGLFWILFSLYGNVMDRLLQIGGHDQVFHHCTDTDIRCCFRHPSPHFHTQTRTGAAEKGHKGEEGLGAPSRPEQALMVFDASGNPLLQLSSTSAITHLHPTPLS